MPQLLNSTAIASDWQAIEYNLQINAQLTAFWAAEQFVFTLEPSFKSTVFNYMTNLVFATG